MLDLVPLRGAGRIVADRDHQAGHVGQLLQLNFPQPNPRSIGAAAIGCDQQPIGPPIAHAPDPLMPGPDGVDRELGRVMVDAQADPAVVIERIVDPIRRHLAQGLVREVMHVDRLGRALRPVVAAAVLEGANQFLLLASCFLVSTEITGWPASRKAQARALMWANWLSRSGWRAPSRVLRLVCRQ